MSIEGGNMQPIPVECHGCQLRPIENGGNGGCDDLQSVLRGLDEMRRLATDLQKLLPEGTADIPKSAKYALIDGVLDHTSVITGTRPLLHGEPVQVCVKPLSKFVGEKNKWGVNKTIGIISLAKIVILSKKLNIPLGEATEVYEQD